MAQASTFAARPARS